MKKYICIVFVLGFTAHSQNAQEKTIPSHMNRCVTREQLRDYKMKALPFFKWIVNNSGEFAEYVELVIDRADALTDETLPTMQHPEVHARIALGAALLWAFVSYVLYYAAYPAHFIVRAAAASIPFIYSASFALESLENYLKITECRTLS